MTTRLVIVGAKGQLGIELCRAQLPSGWVIEAPDRTALDLSNPLAAEAALARLRPDVVINAAAYTAVDDAEREPALAFALNRDGAGAIARAAAACNAPFVHVSTDYVFNGDARTAYGENDPTAPLGVYGRSKAEGEQAVLTTGPKTAVVRTSWVFSAHRANFVKTMLRLGQSRSEVGVVADQHGRPTAASDLAEACLLIAERLQDGDERAGGVFHFANAGDTNWADFAEAIFAGSFARGRAFVRVKRITTADYPTLTKRPANSRLDTTKFETVLGRQCRPWSDGLAECLDALILD